jgi:hypothetical protein
MLTTDPAPHLKRDVLGRVTLPASQREALLDEFERSGMKGLPFAQLVGIHYQTFASWIQKRRRARGDYAALAKPIPQLIEVCAPQKKHAHKALRLVEAVVPVEAVAVPDLHENATLSSASSPISLPTALQACAALEVRLPGGASMLVTDSTQAALAAQILSSLQTSC